GTLNFTPDYNKMVLHLYRGEILQSQNQIAKNYKKVNFAEYIVPIDAGGFGFSKSEDGVISRGQREMSIKDMSVIRDEALKRAKVYRQQLDEMLKTHLDFMLKGNPAKNNEIFKQQNIAKNQLYLNGINRL